jgi:hypothetical protein
VKQNATISSTNAAKVLNRHNTVLNFMDFLLELETKNIEKLKNPQADPVGIR